MFNGILFFAFLFAGIVLGILYNKIRVINYPENKRKSGYFLAVIIFVGASLSIYVVTSIKTYLNLAVTNYSVTIEKYFIERYSDNELVRNGASINQLNEILINIGSSRDIVVSIMPSEDEFGVGTFVYNIIVDNVSNYIDAYVSDIKQSVTNTMDKYAKDIAIFTDTNGSITVSSIINGLAYYLLNRINQILLIIILIVNIPFYIYIIATVIGKINMHRKIKNDGQNDPAMGE